MSFPTFNLIVFDVLRFNLVCVFVLTVNIALIVHCAILTVKINMDICRISWKTFHYCCRTIHTVRCHCSTCILFQFHSHFKPTFDAPTKKKSNFFFHITLLYFYEIYFLNWISNKYNLVAAASLLNCNYKRNVFFFDWNKKTLPCLYTMRVCWFTLRIFYFQSKLQSLSIIFFCVFVLFYFHYSFEIHWHRNRFGRVIMGLPIGERLSLPWNWKTKKTEQNKRKI